MPRLPACSAPAPAPAPPPYSVLACPTHLCSVIVVPGTSQAPGWPTLYLEYFFHIKLDLRLVIVDRNKLHFTSSYALCFLRHEEGYGKDR